MEKSSEPTLRFDLTGEAQRFRTNVGFLRYIFAALLVAIIITIGDQVVTGLILQSNLFLRELTIAVILFLCGLAVYGYWFVFYTLSPSVTSLDLDSVGLTLTYPNERVVRVRWKDPNLKLRLRRMSETGVGFDSQPPTERAVLWGPMRKLNWVRTDVLDAILSQARRDGLSITQRSSTSSKETTVNFEITARAATSSASPTPN